MINGKKLAKPGCCAGAAHALLIKKSIILVFSLFLKARYYDTTMRNSV